MAKEEISMKGVLHMVELEAVQAIMSTKKTLIVTILNIKELMMDSTMLIRKWAKIADIKNITGEIQLISSYNNLHRQLKALSLKT